MKLITVLLCFYLSFDRIFVLGFPSTHFDPSHFSDEVLGIARRANEKRLLFDPLTTPIDVSGEHCFIAPNYTLGDQRGACPALNALSNHGWIDRGGVTNPIEVIGAVNEVFGMGIEIATYLAVIALVFVGNPLGLNPSFSIDQPSSRVNNILFNLFGLLGTPRGLSGSHNLIEADGSMTRDDLYLTGDAATMNMSKFESLYALPPADKDFTLDIFAKIAAIRFRESIETNPDFYYGPATGLVFRNSGIIFAPTMFANHSIEHPEGVLTRNTLKSFFGVTGEDGNLTHNRGWERIPENWYRRPVDLGLVELNLHLVGFILQYPELASIGGNTGTVNSFTGLDLSDITGGVLNAVTLLEGNNLMCFLLEVVKTLAPNSLSTLFKTLEVPLKMITDALDAALLDLTDCPAFKDLTIGGHDFADEAKKMFPGAAKKGDVF